MSPPSPPLAGQITRDGVITAKQQAHTKHQPKKKKKSTQAQQEPQLPSHPHSHTHSRTHRRGLSRLNQHQTRAAHSKPKRGQLGGGGAQAQASANTMAAKQAAKSRKGSAPQAVQRSHVQRECQNDEPRNKWEDKRRDRCGRLCAGRRTQKQPAS